MHAGQVEVGFSDAKIAKSLQAAAPQRGEFVEQLVGGFICDQGLKREPFKGFEGSLVLAVEDDAHARNPIGQFAMHQVAEHIDRAKGLWRPPAIATPQTSPAAAR